MDQLTYYDWITDTSVDDQGAWSFVSDAGFKKVSTLVHNLVDNVSKNGYLLLNVGPKADGSIPDGAKRCLEGMGEVAEGQRRSHIRNQALGILRGRANEDGIGGNVQ